MRYRTHDGDVLTRKKLQGTRFKRYVVMALIPIFYTAHTLVLMLQLAQYARFRYREMCDNDSEGLRTRNSDGRSRSDFCENETVQPLYTFGELCKTRVSTLKIGDARPEASFTAPSKHGNLSKLS